MVPTTIGGLLALLGLVFPGITYSLVRDRYQTPKQTTSFREIAGIVCIGAVATTASLIVLSLLDPFKWRQIIQEWVLLGSEYASRNLVHLLFACLTEVLVASALAGFVSWLRERPKKSDAMPIRRAETVLSQFLFPKGTTRKVTWVTVCLNSGDEINRKIIDVDDDGPADTRHLMLSRPVRIKNGNEEGVGADIALLKLSEVREVWAELVETPLTD